MNLLARMFLFNAVLLPACAQLPAPTPVSSLIPSTLTSTTTSTTAAAPMQEVWLNAKSAQADYKTLSECQVKAKITTNQITATENPGSGILSQLGGMVKESLEESKQFDNCMIAKGYAKIKVASGQTFTTAQPDRKRRKHGHKKPDNP
ncbi:hypothetical protein [Methylocucumis oryzae]|uniref:Lipoprotein n=1 Tax=Methylocucumis oryzae TaxID=1632867 RepID=A0A0F3IJB7_9GAMM|nr:hypothetical protein [Methylocucumis oryzae]KJV06865.1 hypothetical protein VZ94_08450 [Methylocucumis oryzae]